MAEDLHENKSSTGVRILGGDFEIKSLKRQIRVFDKNALTDLKICFEQTRPQEAAVQATANTVTEHAQKFVFPFSDDKNLTHFQAKFINQNGVAIQTLTTELKEKEKAKDEYQQSVSDSSKVGAIVTTAFKSDEYTIEMGNKPEGTKYIDVELKYFETLKTEYRYKERLFTMTVPRHKKTRYDPLYADGMDVDVAPDISDSSRWIDQIEIIEPSPSNTTGKPAYQILRLEWDDKHWEIDNMDGEEFAEGKKRSFYEIEDGVPSGERRDQEGNHLPDIAPVVGQAKNDLEVRFFMRTNVPPAINIEYMDASESEAIVSIELSEENLREQIANMPAQDTHADNNMEYDSNNTPGSSVVSAQPMEYVFLIDCSGSMSGTFIENTRQTMSLIMKSIDVGSKVIFCRFGSRYIFSPVQNGQAADDDEDDHYYPYHRRNRQPRVPEMRDANWIHIDDEDDEQEETIKNYISEMNANLGGTEIQGPLLDILQLTQAPGVYRNIIVLTDGAVTNTKEVLDVVREATIRHEGYLRFFSLGIGSGASTDLCDGIAKEGRGSGVYVLDNDRIQAKASLIYDNASRPSIYLERLNLPPTLERLGFSLNGDLDMSVFGFKRLYLHLKSRNGQPVHMNLLEGIGNGIVSLEINRERIEMQHLQHNMQPWYNPGVRLAAFWAKQEINYLEDLSEPLRVDAIPAQFQNLTPDEAKKAIQIAASVRGGTLCDHTAFVGVMDRVGHGCQQQPFSIQHEASNTSNHQPEVQRNIGYMAAGGSSSPFGRPPPSGGIGSGRAMFSGVTAKGGMPMAGGFGGRPPMAGGIGGIKARSMKRPKRGVSKPDSNNKEKDDKLSTFDKLMSLVKRNGLWPASEGKAVLECLMKYNKNFDKMLEDLRNRIEAVDLILTLLVLAALEKYEEKNQIEWARIAIKAKKKLSTENIDADGEIKALSMAL